VTTQSGVFVLQGTDSLVAMQPAEFAKEDDFQLLLSRFPALLVGDQIDPENPRRWLLVKREQIVTTGEHGASSWSIDHLFLDQDGIPTLVEIKRQSDTRIRREVVGQMLDYAANCLTYWSLDMLQAGLESTCAAEGKSTDAILNELIGSDLSIESFWQQVKTNLIAGRIRMLFVADKIPLELRRIVEFLNTQMSPAEVLAIELRQFSGEGLRTLVPMVFGQTQEAASRKSNGAPVQRWTEERFFNKLSSTVGQKELEIAHAIFDWMRKKGRTLVFGTGQENGSVYPTFRSEGVKINPAYLSTDGNLWLQFGSLQGKPIFGPLEKRRQLMHYFDAIEGAGLSESDLGRYPALPLAKIAADSVGLQKIISALEWMDDQIANSG
jgi:hypothetical protein